MAEQLASDYVSGGYYLTRRVSRTEYMSPTLIPDKVLSASGCICEFFPDDWAIGWVTQSDEERTKEAAHFGISATDLPGVVEWATTTLSTAFGWPCSFYTLDAALEARAMFLPEALEIVVFGLGIHYSDVSDFVKAAEPPPPKPGIAAMGKTGIYECVKRGERIAPGGRAAGFELLATAYALLTCSWLCNGLEKDCAAQLGVGTNQQGFVQTYADASRCAEFISRDETGAEPGLWLPWLLTIYST